MLGKARLNGIESLEKLEFEADIGHTQDIGSRMTDTVRHREDLDLWLLLLEFNQHRHGVKGAKAIWRAMMFRGKPVKLESRNRNASDLVQSIITSATKDIPFLKRFSLDCVYRDIFRDQLFVWVVGALLLLNPKAAPALAIRLKDPCLQGKHDLLELVQIACQSTKEDSIYRLCQVRNCLPDFRIYDEVMPVVWDTSRVSDAFMMHRNLLARGDFPQSFDALRPFVQHFVATGESLESFLRGLAFVGVSFEAQIRRYYANQGYKAAQNPSRIVAQDAFEGDPRKPSDETIARTLVTFPFEFAIQSLRFFGLIEVGPLSVRQIVRSSADSGMLKERFEKLREYEIDTGSSAYVRLLKRLATSGLYEDRDLQRRLLKQGFLRNDYRQANKALTILHQGHISPFEQRRSINLLLQSAIAAGDWPKILDLVDQISHQGHEVEIYTLNFLIQRILQQEFTPADPVDRIAFLVGVLQRLLAAGTPIQPATWLRPLTALGMQGRLDELESLMIWLAEWDISAPRQPHVFDRDLTKLFTPGLQRALLSWSFNKVDWKEPLDLPGAAGKASPPTEDSQLPWLWGARLLKRLHDECQVEVSLPDLQTVFVFRVKQLYHAHGRYRLVFNRRNAHTRLAMSPQRYLHSWSKFWGEPIPSDQFNRIKEMIRTTSPGKRRRSRAGWSKQDPH